VRRPVSQRWSRLSAHLRAVGRWHLGTLSPSLHASAPFPHPMDEAEVLCENAVIFKLQPTLPTSVTIKGLLNYMFSCYFYKDKTGGINIQS
jgi:hypothetical protein